MSLFSRLWVGLQVCTKLAPCNSNAVIWQPVGYAEVAAPVQLGFQIPLFIFCYYMYKWERTDLIPIRPNEGEELPCSILGPRTVREATFLKSFERAVPGVAGSS